MLNMNNNIFVPGNYDGEEFLSMKLIGTIPHHGVLHDALLESARILTPLRYLEKNRALDVLFQLGNVF